MKKMKKAVSLLLLLAMLMSSCNGTVSEIETAGENEETAVSTDETADSDEVIELGYPDETGDETEEIDDTDETETSLPQIEPPNGEQQSAGDDVMKMTIPAAYSQVYNKIKDLLPEELVIYDSVPVSEAETIPETMAPEEIEYSVPTDSGADYSDDTMGDTVSRDPAEFSKTNTQVAEIDEGDVVKTDGEYIYVLKDGDELIILSADGENTAVISKTDLSSEEYHESAREMYVYEDRVLILSECFKSDERSDYWYRTKSFVTLTVYDVSDPTEPDIIANVGQDGSYVTSRMMDNDLYLISDYELYGTSEIDPVDYEAYIPALYTNGVKSLVEPGCIMYPPVVERAAYSVVSRYDTKTGELEVNKTVLGAGEKVYMSTNYLYLADSGSYSEESEPYYEDVYKVTTYTTGNRTDIFKFDLHDDIKVVAFGRVNGYLLNQFSLDEYNGHLRVVTTSNTSSYTLYEDEERNFINRVWNGGSETNGLYIFDEVMEIAGKIDGLAEDERVYSVRFSGNVGYFVTFRTVDPLFTVDLTDPTEPKIMSELKIPGFSEYLHSYKDGLLFGLGQSADPETGWTDGVKLSMFDVSDPYNVTEKHMLKLDMSYTEALGNHKAIIVSADKNLIGFSSYDRYVIYGYDADSGFYEKGSVTIDELRKYGGSRGLYIGEYFYIAAQEGTMVLDLESFKLIASIDY